MTTLDVAGLLLFVFYAVSFTKTPFSKVIADPDWQTWAVRLWALVLGIGGALVDSHFGNNAAWNGPQVYDAIKAGGAAAVGAIITYHIGQPGFLGVFDSAQTLGAAVTTVTVKEPVPKPVVAEHAQVSVTQTTKPEPVNPLPTDFKPYTPPVEVVQLTPSPVAPTAAATP